MKSIFIMIVGAFWALTVFGQMYSRTYFNEADRSTFIWQVLVKNEDTIFCNIEKKCSNESLCTNIVNMNKLGKIESHFERFTSSSFKYRMKIRSDTILYSGSFFSERDSTTYWYLSMTNQYGDSLGEYYFPILPLKYTGIGDFGYQTPTNYGLSLVNNNEVMLWGEGLDNRRPNGPKVPYESVFLRVGLDGTQRSDIFWFSKSNYAIRRMSDATTDIDGNLVFPYEYKPDNNDSLKRDIYKVMPNDNIILIAEIPNEGIGRGLPHIAVDAQGNYFVNPIFPFGLAPGYNVPMSKVGFISKVDRTGQVLWTTMIPPYNGNWQAQTYTSHTHEIRRITIAKNGDVLCTGRVSVSDSFVVVGQTQKVFKTGDGSFIARIDTNGKLLWRHFIVPLKKKGQSIYTRRNYIYDIQETPDGHIITGGELERDDDDIDPSVGYDAWIMRLSADGCLTDDCSHIGRYFVFPEDIVGRAEITYGLPLTIYPNPGHERVTIQLPSVGVPPYQYEIVDISGRVLEMGSHKTDQWVLSMDHLVTGLYIIAVRDSQGKVWHGKWVKE